MPFFTDILRFATISQILLLVWLFWSERRGKKGMGICLFFGCTVAGYLLVDWQPLQRCSAVFYPLLVLPFLAPVAFWLFS